MWRRGGDLLEVVENEQHVPASQVSTHYLMDRVGASRAQLQAVGDRARHRVLVWKRRQRDERHAVREAVRQALADRQREPRLAHPARPGERDEPGPAQDASASIRTVCG